MNTERMSSCSGCGTALAVDNLSGRCSPCARRATDRSVAPPQAPAGFWRGPLIERAVAQRDLGAVLSAYRNAFVPPLTQAVLADWLCLSQAQVSRIENGRTQVNDLIKLAKWSSAIGAPPDILWFQTSLDSSGVSAPNDAVATFDDTQQEGTSVRRRAFLKTASLGAFAAGAATITVAGYADQLVPRLVGADDVEVIRETTRMFRQLDNRFGGGHGRNVVSTYLSTEVEPRLCDGRFARGARRDFQRASVELHQLAGWMAYDVGDDTTGRHHLRQALDIADDAGDDALSSEMLAAMSHQAAFARRADEAIDLALAARRAATRSGAPALHAESAALEAHGLALKGDARGCVAALQRAERAFMSATPGNTPPWLRYFDDAYLSAKFAHALRDLGRPADADRFARSSLQMSEGYDRGRLFNTALLASVLIDCGQLDEAVQHAQIAIRMSGRVRSTRARGYLRDIAIRLLPHTSHDTVPELQAELAAVGVIAR